MELRRPSGPVRWEPDRRITRTYSGALRSPEVVKEAAVLQLINADRVRGHLIADLDPLSWKEPHTHPELDPATYGLTIWDLEREFFVDGVAGQRSMLLGDLLGVLSASSFRPRGAESLHLQEPDPQPVHPSPRAEVAAPTDTA